MDRLHETATILTTLNRISLSWRFSFAKISIFFENSYSCCLFFLVFLSLNRTFDLTVLGRLHLGSKRKNLFFFVLLSVCTTFDLTVLGRLHLGIKRKNIFFFVLLSVCTTFATQNR